MVPKLAKHRRDLECSIAVRIANVVQKTYKIVAARVMGNAINTLVVVNALLLLMVTCVKFVNRVLLRQLLE